MKLENPIECWDCNYNTKEKSSYIICPITKEYALYQCFKCKAIQTYPETRMEIMHDLMYEGKLNRL